MSLETLEKEAEAAKAEAAFKTEVARAEAVTKAEAAKAEAAKVAAAKAAAAEAAAAEAAAAKAAAAKAADDTSDDGWIVTDVILPTKKKSDKAEGKVAMPPMDMVPIAGPSSEGVRSALAAMGFSDKSLIELIIATHGEDVEACARALAAASEWAHLLDDLEEMGFSDRELNKSLMLKNAGNMKRTVRDLVEA